MDQKYGQGHDEAEDPLAYGDYHGGPGDPAERPPEEGDYAVEGEGERGIIGDTYRKFRGKYQQDQSGEGGNSKSSGGLGSFIFHKLHDAVNDIGSKIDGNLAAAGATTHSHTHVGTQCSDGIHQNEQYRFGSFATQRTGNDAKWYVDGCNYMWAVSRAFEQATSSIWILDCKPCKLQYLASMANQFTRVAVS